MTEHPLADQLECLIGTIAACLHADQERIGFSPPEWRVLSALAKASSVSLSELTIAVNATTGGTSKIIRKLSLLGLAEWRKVPTNKRQYQIAITSRGKGVHETLSLQGRRETRHAIEKMLNQDLMLAIQLLAQCMPRRATGKHN